MKKQKTYFTIALLVTLTLIAACKRDILPVTKPNLPQLYGTWNWVQTSGGITGVGPSPATVGYSLAIQFNNDGTCINFKNGQQVEKIYYTLTSGTSFVTGQPTHFITYIKPGKQNNSTNEVLESLHFYGNDSLAIIVEADDGEENLYLRK